MAIRWDCLRLAMAAPYVPTLGPVHTGAVTPGLFTDVAEIAGTGRFLPHDKDRRWGGHKDEWVLVEASARAARWAGPASWAGGYATTMAPGEDGWSGSCRRAVTLILLRPVFESRCEPSAPAIMFPP